MIQNGVRLPWTETAGPSTTLRSGRDDNWLWGHIFLLEVLAGTTELSSRRERSVGTCGDEFEAKNNLRALLDRVELGEALVITRHGKPVAALVPLDTYRRSSEQVSLLGLQGSGRGLWGDDSRKTLTELRDEWDR